MAIVINNTPADYSSAHGDLVYTVYDSVKTAAPLTYPNYKYILDIYVGGVLVVTLKAFPNPVNLRGVFNIGMVVRNYVSAVFNPTASVIRAQEFPNFYASVQCKFRDEWGGIETVTTVDDSNRKFYNHYNGRMLGGYSILGGYLNKVASNRPTTTSVQLNGGQVFMPFFPSTSSAYSIVVVSYDSSNAVIATSSVGVTAPTSGYILQQLNFSPIAINSITPGAIPSNTDYYTVSSGSTLYRFIIYCEPRYVPATLHFLNQFGGFDSMDFPKISRKGNDIEKKDFLQTNYTINASGVMSYYNGNVLSDNRITFFSNYKERRIINTDFISESGSRWLGELVRSPQVYLEEGGYYIPIIVKEAAYEYKTRSVDRLFSLTLNIEMGDDQNTQFR